jgi:hypothetical protein
MLLAVAKAADDAARYVTVNLPSDEGLSTASVVALVVGVLAATSAILASWLTARGASRRQAADFKEQSARLREQLAHERVLRDKEELRAILDRAATELNHVGLAGGRVLAVLGADGVPDELIQERKENFHEANWELTHRETQLTLRLGRDHVVTKAFTAAHSEFRRMSGAIFKDEAEGGADLKEASAAYSSSSPKSGTFEVVAVRFVGSELDVDAPPT